MSIVRLSHRRNTSTVLGRLDDSGRVFSRRGRWHQLEGVAAPLRAVQRARYTTRLMLQRWLY